MSNETIDHNTLVKLIEANAVRGIQVIGQIGGWGVMIKYGMAERPLSATRSGQVRVFKKLDTAMSYLKGIGIARFEVDAVNYDATSLTVGTRPDRSAALKLVHAAAKML